MAKGKLIIIEAGDGSGKATQTACLYQHLTQEGYQVRQVSFPDYDSPSSALIKMYLSGQFGAKPESVNAYAASTFFAVDRYASFQKDWRSFYEAGGVILADRYTTSNMVHQSVKMTELTERQAYLTWLEDFEYEKLGLPKPDVVLFLDMAPEFSLKLIKQRQTLGSTPDIHEADGAYLTRCYEVYCELANQFQWQKISCLQNGQLKTVAQIHDEIYEIVKKALDYDKIETIH